MRWWIVLLAMAASTPVAHAQAPERLPAGAMTAIASADSEWFDAMRRHDVARVVAPYDADAVFISADGSTIRGRERIADLYRSRFHNIVRVSGGGIVQDGTRAASDTLVYEWGHGGMTYTDSSNIEHTSRGPYLTVWRRTPAGEWLIIRNLVF